jgi:hypothetical protein
MLASEPVRISAARLFLAVLLGSCGPKGSTQAKPPPIYPQDLPVILEPTEIANFSLPRTTVAQVKILDPKLSSAVQSDTFHQNQGLLDVLWVVANTGIMRNERDILAQDLPSFTQVLTDARVDWQIGVTSSDLSTYVLPDGTPIAADGGYLHGPLITQQDPNYLLDFQQALTWPILRESAPSQVAVFACMKLAIDFAQPGGVNQGLVRPGASLAVIAATNADDQSFGEVAWYARWMKGLKGAGNENLVTFSALGGPTPSGCTPPGQEKILNAHVDPTVRLHELVTATGGVFESICDEAGFNGALGRIARNLKTLRKYFPLSVTPDIATISVTVDGRPVAQDPDLGWQYLAAINSIAFLGSYVPDPGASVVITYAVSG